MFSLSEWQISSSTLEEERGRAKARKPGLRQVSEKDEEGDGRARIPEGKAGKSKVTVRMRGQKAAKGKKQKKKKKREEEPGMDINEQEGNRGRAEDTVEDQCRTEVVKEP